MQQQWSGSGSGVAAPAKKRKLVQGEARAGGAANPVKATRIQRLGFAEGARSVKAAPRTDSQIAVRRSGSSIPISVGSAFKQLVAQASKGTRCDTTKRTNEKRAISCRPTAELKTEWVRTWTEKPAGSATSEEAPGLGSSSSGSGSTAVLVKTAGVTKSNNRGAQC